MRFVRDTHANGDRSLKYSFEKSHREKRRRNKKTGRSVSKRTLVGTSRLVFTH